MTLRASETSVRSSSRIVFRTYCCVIVEAPSVPNPWERLTTTARPRPWKSTPLWLKNRSSSVGYHAVDQVR